MSADDKPKIEVRELSLAQLQRLTVHGSRRARAELERRLAAFDVQGRSEPRLGAAIEPVRVAAPSAPRLSSAASPQEMAASAAASGAPGTAFSGNRQTQPQISQDVQILQLQAQAQQDESRQRAEGPPGLVGMALMAWGALMLLGGLILLQHKGGLYYILFGLACAGIGWLLLRCKRSAIWAHAACIVVALLWAWRSDTGNTIVATLVLSAPIWISALWIAVPPIREPLH